MIRIESLHIEEFRGIRELDLTLGGKSFVVYGPNGSGKSGVVDAIDFAITGSIQRLHVDGKFWRKGCERIRRHVVKRTLYQ